MAETTSPANRAAEIRSLESRAVRAGQNGRDGEAAALWQQLLALEPSHALALTALGQQAFRRGDAATAHALFTRATESDSRNQQYWINLALACQALKDEAGEEAAIKRVLTLDPMELVALILRANLLERQGKTHQAANAYGAVATVAPPLDRLHPDLRPAVSHAIKYRQEYDRKFATFLDGFLEPHYRDASGEKLERFRDSVDILLGRKRRYDSLSEIYHYPYLAPIQFFDRELFPWLDAFEAGTDAIRDEFLRVLDTEDGFVPYITYSEDLPVNQFAELNNSPRWSAFHLFKMGERVEENAARCPFTMSLLAQAPQPVQAGRTPAAMYSLLKPHTRIPAHNGVTNVRLVTHVPLIVPEGCGFRVGNATREWVPGQGFVFDDTIEHEAWNDSDKLRVVLLFDVWHPHLSEAERTMITALASAMRSFSNEEFRN